MIRRPLENSRDRICRTVNRITETVIAKILSPGERIKGEGGRKTQIKFPRFMLNECILPATAIIHQTGE